MHELTERQQKVLGFICKSIDERGYPPTLREIGNQMGIRSTNGVNDHLRALERKGFLTREDMKSRTLRPTDHALQWGRVSKWGELPIEGDWSEQADDSNGDFGNVVSLDSRRTTPTLRAVSRIENDAQAQLRPTAKFYDDDSLAEIPIVGRVAAGLPLEAIQSSDNNTVRIDRQLLGKQNADVFGLRIVGESMIEAGIHDGDYVFVRKQQQAERGAMVIAMVDGEATCKYYYPEKDVMRLEPANAAMKPILVHKSEWKDTSILGVVVASFRKY